MRRLLLILCLPASTVLAAPLYVRGALGYEQARHTTLRDADCTSTQPPALFGCGFGARGGFGHAFVPEVAVGMELPLRSRVEVALAHRSFDLDARSNFLNTPDPQTVRAEARATSLMINGAIDLTATGLRPFITAGAGLSRNSIDRVHFAFPGISPDAVTITQGGSRTNFAWNAGLGLSWAIGNSLDLELVVRRSDSGQLRTDAGAAHIVRPTRTFDLDIAATRAEMRSTGISVGLRWRR